MLRALPHVHVPNWPVFVASALLVATCFGLALDIALWAGQRFMPPPVSFIQGQPIFVVEMFFALAYASMGWLLAGRLPRNPLGWAFLALGLAMAYQMAATFLVQEAHQVFRPVDTFLLLAAWAGSSVHLPLTVTLFVVVFLRFPTGKPLTPRWRGVGRLTALGALLLATGVGLDPRGLMWYPSLPNPFAVPAALPVLGPLIVAGVLLVTSGVVISTASMIVRYRRADETQRLQLRWIAVAVALLAAGGLPFVIGRYALELDFRSGELLLAVALAAGCLLPIAAAVAVLRYHLYDIDIIINRALVYIPLTAIIGGLYATGVAVGQRVFIAITGDTSDAAIVIVTLIAASLFTHIRSTLQSFVDRFLGPARRTPVPELPELIPADQLRDQLARLERRLEAIEADAARHRS